MRPPLHLMKQAAVVLVATTTAQTDGSTKIAYTATGAPSVACSFQPASSREALTLQRELGTTTYDLYCAPSDSNGNPTTSTITHASKLRVGSLVLRVIGEPLDDCSAGAVVHVIAEGDT